MDRFWMVINAAEGHSLRDGWMLPFNQGARFIHWSRESAEAEALRLQKEHVAGEFYILESISEVKQTKTDPSVYYVEEGKTS